ncbi:MAG: flagellar biosynthesis protein FliQ [Halanaerobiaceae bacterium]|nr:flagellar biosynthesis protein FliQ [Halanaerobiaceae bacterium]
MDQSIVITIGREGLLTVIKIIIPVAGLGLLTGLLVAVFQATTQIHEQTLAFIPKILVIMIALILFGPWMITTLVDFVVNLFRNIPYYIR